MNVETIVNDVKGKVEPIVAKGQEAVQAGFETLKTANSIVVEGVQTLVKTNVEAGKDLLAAAQTSFEKAKADGIKTVAANPVAYLPEGKERVISAYNDTVTLVTKTGDELVKTFKQGYESINAAITGEAVVVTKAKTTVKKVAAKAKKTAKAAA
ncbi:MAG: phasin family protein [Nevskiaceae bacterium]|nr:MAG: phasin family protein [Nevskiaceae bacterium]